ncbi:hypothetical protein C7B65_15195 [Phormidesmis priestleyi ULC007]|uniref:Uncharacterized protein n=1 Tax=Phormidesmis priestleyi ULC007 TaxID=1920490 RepID=A0A2T1DD79_9CYAN|nr:hypothetical protein [Phormidesmis priestleyi]PSB18438.1 hypothetical protein C7B65_15195 [Phormidesmis priestleyi ULC007]PZO48835.1 MAG: hypothetical protein DCF14_15995 [Phormidesmis priestleyi]
MWNLLSEISISTQWDWTPPTTGEWFRFEFEFLQEVKVDIVQGDGLALYGVPIRVTTNNPQVLYFKRPPFGLTDQCIAVRTGDRAYRTYSLGWKIKIFVTNDEPESEHPVDFSTQQAQILNLLEELMPLARSNPAAVVSTAATSTPVTAAITNTVLSAANPNRKGLIFYSAASGTLYVNLGETASLTDYSFNLGAGDYQELPFGYVGAVSGIWDAAGGSVFVTELS